MKVASRLARVSAYSHVEDHLRVKTVHGGIVTIMGATLALMLFVSEVGRCLRVEVKQNMEVDTSMDPALHVDFNLTFPALPCRALRLETGDVGGKFETESMMSMAKDGEVHKWQLDSHGRRLHRAEYIPPRGYDNPFVLTINADDMEEVVGAVQRHEGCNVYGWLQVHRVAGNIHFAVRPEALMAVQQRPEVLEALLQRHIEIHDDPDHPEAHMLNASHIIHTLRFGDTSYPGQVHPLEGVVRIDRKATGIDKYFVKVVPTEYRSLWGWVTDTYQYSVTEYYTRLVPEMQMLPGVYVLYDTWPIKVKLRAGRRGVLKALVRVCAVCGGVWAMTAAVDKLVHQAVTAAKRATKKSRAP